MHKGLPPVLLYTIFKLYSQRSVIPRISQTSIDLRSWEDKSPALAERDDLVEGGGGHVQERVAGWGRVS